MVVQDKMIDVVEDDYQAKYRRNSWDSFRSITWRESFVMFEYSFVSLN